MKSLRKLTKFQRRTESR